MPIIPATRDADRPAELPAAATAPLWSVGRFTVDPAGRLVVDDGGLAVDVGARAFDLLLALLAHRDRVVSQDELLRRVWPGRVVQPGNLQVQISALRKAIGVEAIATVPGYGYRLVATVLPSRPERRSRPDEPRQPLLPASAPFPISAFVGRDEQLVECADLLADVRLLTLTGVGGTGKTRLALQLAREVADDYPGGVHFIDLAPLREPSEVAARVIAAFDRREAKADAGVDVVVHALAGRQALLLLDNCEHLIQACAELAHTLLQRCATLRILATSRERLGVAGEQVYAVPPLSLPPDAGGEAVLRCESARLFREAARRASPQFEPGAADAAHVASICRRLDGLPLAIELAAAQLRVLSVADLDARLRDGLRILVGGPRADPRHRTMTAALAWSFDRLEPAEQALLARLSVFVGGFTLAAATAVGALDDEYATFALLTSLHDRSLLRFGPSEAQPARFSLLEPVRQFAQDPRVHPGEKADARRRHAEYFADLAESYRTTPLADWMACMRAEHANLLAAQARARECAHSSLSLRFCAALVSYWVNSGQAAIGFEQAEAALQAPPAAGDEKLRRRACASAASLALHQGQLDRSLEWSEQAFALDEPIDDQDEHGLLVESRAIALLKLGRADEARPLIVRVCDEARRSRSLRLLGRLLSTLGDVERALGASDRARAAYQESLAIASEQDHPIGIGVALNDLAVIDIDRTGGVEAPALIERSLELAQRTGIHRLTLDALEAVATLASLRHDDSVAARWFGCAAGQARSGRRSWYLGGAGTVSRYSDRTRRALGEARFDAAAAAGEALDPGAALAEALRWVRGARAGG